MMNKYYVQSEVSKDRWSGVRKDFSPKYRKRVVARKMMPIGLLLFLGSWIIMTYNSYLFDKALMASVIILCTLFLGILDRHEESNHVNQN